MLPLRKLGIFFGSAENFNLEILQKTSLYYFLKLYVSLLLSFLFYCFYIFSHVYTLFGPPFSRLTASWVEPVLLSKIQFINLKYK
jgi:hypothetical protein